jgi:hypothetical protein
MMDSLFILKKGASLIYCGKKALKMEKECDIHHRCKIILPTQYLAYASSSGRMFK